MREFPSHVSSPGRIDLYDRLTPPPSRRFAPLPNKEPALDDKVVFDIEWSGSGSEAFLLKMYLFRINKTAKMKKLFQKFTEKFNRPSSDFSFRLSGEPIGDNDTPLSIPQIKFEGTNNVNAMLTDAAVKALEDDGAESDSRWDRLDEKM